MRFFEYLFIVSLLFVLLVILVAPKWNLGAVVYPFLVGTTLLLGIVQLLAEGYRWQFMPAYLLITLLTLHAVSHSFQPPVTRPTLVFAVGLVGWLFAVGMAWALPVPKLPAPTGDFAVGTTTIQLKDESRMEIYGENAGSPRELQLQIWYPAENAGIKPAPYLENLDLVLPVVGERLGIPSFLLGHLKYAQSYSQPNAPLLDNSEPFPVLLFAHGYNAFRAQNTHLMETLASHGYVVASADHTHGTAFTVLDNNRVYLLDPTTINFDTTQTTIDSSNILVNQWADDLDFILSTLTTWNNADPNNLFTNRLDLTKVGALGQSTGGATIVEWCKRGDQCAAGLTLDGWFVPVAEAQLQNPPDIPMLLMRKEGGISEIADTRMRRFYENVKEGYWLTIDGTEHYNFADLPIVSPLSNRIGLAGEINHYYALAIQDDYTLQFFDHYLLGKPAPILETTTSPYPEVSFESTIP